MRDEEFKLCHISKILKNESNSQHKKTALPYIDSCVISQRYSKMKAIHNRLMKTMHREHVVSYLKDTQK